MFSLLTFLIGAIFNLLKSKKELSIQIYLYKKELEILKRQNQKKRLKFYHCDRIIFSIQNRIGNIRETISIIKPETVLGWQRCLIKHFWTYKTKKRVGRPSVLSEIKQIIQKLDHIVYMIHDLTTQFNLNYIAYGIKGIKTSVKAPNMNALAERLIGSIRREALDNYLLISEKQIMRILQEYIDYYNSKRPHQGIDQKVPMGYTPQFHGRVQKFPILGGLCNHYFRSSE